MSAHEVRKLITETARILFNEHSSRAISTNRVADQCNLSRGHLHYHFKTKSEVINEIHQRLVNDLDNIWDDLSISPTLDCLYLIFSRQMKVFWHYKFLQLEISSLSKMDRQLRAMHIENHNHRVERVGILLQRMIDAGYLKEPSFPVTVTSLAEMFQLITYHWLQHLDLFDESPAQENTSKGFGLLIQALHPYLKQPTVKQVKLLCSYAD